MSEFYERIIRQCEADRVRLLAFDAFLKASRPLIQLPLLPRKSQRTGPRIQGAEPEAVAG